MTPFPLRFARGYRSRPPLSERARTRAPRMPSSLRIALVLNPFTLRRKGGEHAPCVARGSLCDLFSRAFVSYTLFLRTTLYLLWLRLVFTFLLLPLPTLSWSFPSDTRLHAATGFFCCWSQVFLLLSKGGKGVP